MDEGSSRDAEKAVTLSAAMRLTGYGKTKLRAAFDAGEITGFRATGPGGVECRFFDRTSVAQWTDTHPHRARPEPSPDNWAPPSPVKKVKDFGASDDGRTSTRADNSPRLGARYSPDESTASRQSIRDTTQSDQAAENVALRVVIDALLDALIEEAASRHRGLQALRTAFRGLDGVRPAILPTDLLEELRDLRPRGL